MRICVKIVQGFFDLIQNWCFCKEDFYYNYVLKWNFGRNE